MTTPDETAVTDLTPGQKAHHDWHRARWPDSTELQVAKEWEILSDRARHAWEVAALAGAEGREAWLVRKLNESIDETGALREHVGTLAEVEAAARRHERARVRAAVDDLKFYILAQGQSLDVVPVEKLLRMLEGGGAPDAMG